MNSNFHTHTTRCHHAIGSESEYIEAAIKNGIKKLGFSDHSPYFFEGNYYSNFRMTPDESFEYAEKIRSLQREYAGKIEIFLGFEAEYYPKTFNKLLRLYEQIKPDYVILGQHALNNEYDGMFSTTPTVSEDDLLKYVDQVTEAIDTGVFSYVAHPDVINFKGDRKIFEKHFKKLCLKARDANLPLEVNFLGISDKRHYPSERFLQCAKECGNDLIFGIDAHSTEALLSVSKTEEKALKLIEPFDITVTDKIKLLNGKIV